MSSVPPPTLKQLFVLRIWFDVALNMAPNVDCFNVSHTALLALCTGLLVERDIQCGSFPKLGVPYFVVLIIRILLFRVLY